MTEVAVVARAAVTGGPLESVVCHPRLPLIAGLASDRPAVRVWDCASGGPTELGSVGTDAPEYGEAKGWARIRQAPTVVWHPHEPQLLVATAGRVQRWTPADVAELPGISPRAEYRALAFDPNGQMLWAAPSADDRDDAWTSSDVLDPDSGVIGTGPRWDTAMVTHPGGALLLTLQSDQGATLGLFARVDQSTEPVSWRVLRRALILDADGYEAPVFSSDGRHLAVRGNAYENSLEVFEFPSLNRVLATTLGDPNPGYPYPAEWLEQRAAWSRQNIAFASEPGMLWVGTPDGALLEIDIDGERASRHDVLDRAPIAALAASQGQLVVATSASELVIVNIRRESIESRDVQPDALVQAFLESTSDAPDDFDWEQQLLVTDGTDSWDPNDLERVTKAKPSDPTWLQLKAAINTARDGNA